MAPARPLPLLLALGAAALLQVVAVCTIPQGPWFRDVVDDFTRDLIGIAAVDRGLSPYQHLGEITGPTDIRMPDQWVAHTPASIVVAIASLEAAGSIDAAAFGARMANAGLALAVAVFGIWKRRWWLVATPLLAVATAAFASNWMWNQHGLVIAALLSLTLWLDHTDRRPAAILLLGALVSLKPWLLPVAAFLSPPRFAWRNMFLVGAVAGGATLCCLPFLGGWSTLRDWLAVALPANYAFWAGGSGNVSLTASLPGPLSFLLFLLMPLVIARIGQRGAPQHLRPLLAWFCVLTLPNLVWSHYLVDIGPLLLFAFLLAPDVQRRGPLLIILASLLPSALAPWSSPHLLERMGLVLARGIGAVVISAALIASARRLWKPDRPLRTLDRALALFGAASEAPARSTPA